jgi:hypothetical protein
MRNLREGLVEKSRWSQCACEEGHDINWRAAGVYILSQIARAGSAEELLVCCVQLMWRDLVYS